MDSEAKEVSVKETGDDCQAKLKTTGNKLFTLPHDGLVDQNGLDLVLECLSRQENVFAAVPKTTNSSLSGFLSYHMNILGMEPRTDLAAGHQAVGDCLTPKRIHVALRPRDTQALRLASLKTLSVLFKTAKKSKIFSFWYALLPGCASNPYKRALFDLVGHPDVQIREATLAIIANLFTGSATYLQLANAHCRSGSFTPVCLEFANALARLVYAVAETFDAASCEFNPTHASQVSRVLVVLLEQVPFHKLEHGLLSNISDRMLACTESSASNNPVIHIAVLLVCAAIVSLSPPHPEVVDRFSKFFSLFMDRSFPAEPSSTTLVQVPAVDNNTRYISLQNLGRLASMDIYKFLSKSDTLLSSLDIALRSDPDQSIVIHGLRLVKTIGKCGNGLKDDELHHGEVGNRMLHFWLAILRPGLLDAIEARNSPVLRAALCDCLAEIAGVIFSRLPTDRRLLAVTFMLRQCRDADHRVVTSACRGIGMMVALPSLQIDSAFLTDCADILLDLLHEDKSPHRNVIISGTWALSNLVDSLAKQQQQVSELEEDSSSTGLVVEFPPHITLQLVRIAINYSANVNSHMNIRANCVRSLGSLLQCMDFMMVSADHGNSSMFSSEDPLVMSLIGEAVSAVALNITTGKVMKIRWNACYAAGGILKTSALFRDDPKHRWTLIEALLPIIGDFPNFKVRINGALALACVPSRTLFGSLYVDSCVAVVRSLESARSDVEEADEIQHKLDLVDQLCLTFAHLVSLVDGKDLKELDRIMGDYADLMTESMRSVALRISPEKASAFIETQRHLQAISGEGHVCKDDCVVARIFNDHTGWWGE